MKTKRRSLISWLLTVMIVFSLIPATEISTYSAGTEESAQPEKWYSGSELTIDEHFIFGEDRMYTEGKANRGFNNLIDNNASTIFYVTTNDTGVNYQDLTGKEISVTFHTNSPVVINYFKIISGGDTFKASYAHRSPTAWNLKAGNSLDSCDNVLLENLPINATVAYEDNTYKFENNTPYKYYKFTITALAGAGRQGHDSPFSNPTATCLLTDIAIGGPEDSRHSSHDGVEFEPWKSANTLPNTEGSYYLTKDVTISSTWSVPSGTTNLCLNGHSITRTNASGTTGSVINVGSGAVLNLYECDDETTHYYTVANPAQNGAGLGTVVDKSAYDAASENARGTFKGGYITGGYATNGGGVCVDGGSFIMYGGTIIGNEAAGNDTRGGGVRIMGSNGSFTMEGGAILANKCSFYGGAIGLGRNSNGGYPNEKSSLTINGGTIRHNWTGKNGGAIHVIGNNSMISAAITGGSIIDNYTVRQSAGSEWGGALIATFISPKISGAPVIKGNICQENPNDLCATKGIDLSDHLTSGADVGVSLREPAKLSSSDIQVGINVGKDDIQYLHYSGPDEATLVYCDGSKDWVYSDGKIVEFSGAHHTHAAGTLWASAAKPIASITGGENTSYYSDLSSAIGAWTGGGKLTLLEDASYNNLINIRPMYGYNADEYTLDLNGKTFNIQSIQVGLNNSPNTLRTGPHLIIEDSKTGGILRFAESGMIDYGGLIELRGGTLTGGHGTWGGLFLLHIYASLDMYDGVFLTGNTSTYGGAVLVGSDSEFNMYGGKISGNTASDSGGGVVIFDNDAARFNFYGGEIIGNSAPKGGGVSVNVGSFHICGNNAIIKDNVKGGSWNSETATYTGGTPNNVYLPNGKIINIESELSSSPIGVTLQNNTGVFTSGLSGNGTKSSFSSDNVSYDVYINDNGEAMISLPHVASITNGENTSYYSDLSSALSAWADGSTLKLMKDVTTGSTITVPSGEHTLDLNGHGIRRTGTGCVIRVNEQSTLNLKDSDTSTEHKYKVANPAENGAGVATVDDTLTSGYQTFTGGYITGGYNGGGYNYGAGINVEGNGAALNMYGGTIIGNSLTSTSTGGGGVCVQDWDKTGGFNMYGGSIIGNTSNYGGGVYVRCGKMVMYDGEISNNVANNGVGGAVHAFGNSSTFIIEGGTINGNLAQHGGAIEGSGDAIVSVFGGDITNNIAKGKGGALTNQRTDGDNSPATFNISGAPVFSGNTAGGKSGDVYLCNTAVLNVTDELTGTTPFLVSRSSVTGTITSGWKDKMGAADPTKYFTSENTNYVVFVDKDDEISIDYPDVPNVSANGYEGDYDGETHGITVTVPDGATVKYGTQEGSYTLTDNPTYTDAGTYTVYYEVSKDKHNSVTGSATVKINKINVTVTITGHNSTAVYNGEAHSADGYDAAASSELYDVNNDFTFSGRAEAVRINTGTTYMELSADKFENTNSNFVTVTFIVTDGYQTITPTDAVITSKPHAKDKLVYNGKAQELFVKGVVDGGTLMYAIGEDTKSSPADESYSSSVPVASEIGNYYIWYKVEGDSNHNSISPESFKITLADESWITVSGNVYQSSGSTVLHGASVFLMKGNTVVDEITSDKNGSYYFTVPAGIYNIVVKSGDVTVTNIVDGQKDTIHDLTTPDADTDSVLDVSAADKSIVVGGLDIEANAIRANDGVSSDKKVTVKMTVTSVKESETNASQEIGTLTQDLSMEFYDMKVEKTIDSVTTALSETQNVLEIVIPCTYTNKRELTVMSSIGSGVQTLTESDSGAAGTYRVDKQAGLVYIYSDRVTTYAIGYKPYFSVKSDISLGSFKGNMSVKLVKDSTKETFELNDVSPDSISFKGIPKGTYSMTITWTDGAENKITLPFTVKK